MANFVDWLTQNIWNATWWRSKALGQGVSDEGGVDVPLPNRTPIYALATGPLRGAGYFYHGGPYFSSQETGAGGSPGYGVVSEQINVPGLGLEDLYYQHIDIAPGINFCQSGNCGGQIVQKGQLIGWSKSQLAVFGSGSATGPAEAEIGLGANTKWGGIWGAPSDPGSWVSDPRQALVNVAGAGGPVTAGPTNPVDCSFCNQLGPMAVPCMAACQSGSAAGTQFSSTASPQQLAVLGQAGHILQNLTTPDFWVRVGIGIAAIVLIVFALLFFIKDTEPAKGAEHAVEKSALVAA
jgi:hypothetical protein